MADQTEAKQISSKQIQAQGSARSENGMCNTPSQLSNHTDLHLAQRFMIEYAIVMNHL